ncbi:DegT/DnrJ/EryC1/StrS family aminotransferase [Aestuariibaculum lutulentum]|uniref:DegT/DnrJ/EryC1/StrS family aminotransferase n=1 Tax=Aestuariibaculum lutulentum TaxID=2920935 RepID=A0ABS9REH3_9FLAO|nr:DegT/DnrJ/EryC1/StrS family aminotransferase [Aestuariibaculum lutulentum]MCH4551353.1 DegT/DnrJ/EryC1/StrS family aminotransferase [Aestuariibaculum lutulentum]
MIKFLDLHKLNSRFENDFLTVFKSFLDSSNYILGEEVEAFEKEFAQFCGVQYCIGVSNGLDAIMLIFEAYKILGYLREGDEVIVPANTYIATILAISNSGLKPVLVEPLYSTFNINPQNIEQKINSKTRAILGVHLYGQLYDFDSLEKICKKYNLLLIEDAAQAHGASRKDGRKAGNVSDAGAFSFYPTKNLGALGDGGAVTTNNKDLAELVVKLRNYGRTSAYINKEKGFNCRLDEIQAAFLRIKLKELNSDNSKRRDIAKFYFNRVKSENILLPFVSNIEEHVFHLFVVRCSKRNELKKYLLSKGVETAIHYPIPVHKQEAYADLKDCEFPITEQIHDEVLSLPMNPLLSDKDLEIIIKALVEFD